MLFGSLVAAPTFAASLAALQVSVTGNGVIAMQPGEVKEISVTLQNIGTTTWKNDGAGYISLYTHEPKYRHSVFDPAHGSGRRR